MTEAMNHEDFDADGHDAGDDLAAYALGALDAHEAEAFQAHLAGCALCRDELAALQGVVEALPTSVPPYPASKTLRRKLVAAVAAEPRAPRPPRPRPPERRPVRAAGGCRERD